MATHPARSWLSTAELEGSQMNTTLDEVGADHPAEAGTILYLVGKLHALLPLVGFINTTGVIERLVVAFSPLRTSSPSFLSSILTSRKEGGKATSTSTAACMWLPPTALLGEQMSLMGLRKRPQELAGAPMRTHVYNCSFYFILANVQMKNHYSCNCSFMQLFCVGGAEMPCRLSPA